MKFVPSFLALAALAVLGCGQAMADCGACDAVSPQTSPCAADCLPVPCGLTSLCALSRAFNLECFAPEYDVVTEEVPYTVSVPVWREKQVEYTVNVPVTVPKQVECTVCVPETTQKVVQCTRLVPV